MTCRRLWSRVMSAFIDWLFATKSIRHRAITPAELEEYARVFASPGAARAGFNYYRAVFSEAGLAIAKQASTRRLTMPVLAPGGEGSVGNELFKTLQPQADDSDGHDIAGCGHYLADECPAEFVSAIRDFWRSTEADEAAGKQQVVVSRSATRTPGAGGGATGAPLPAGRRDGTGPPRRRSGRRTSDRAAGPIGSRRAAPTSKARPPC